MPTLIPVEDSYLANIRFRQEGGPVDRAPLRITVTPNAPIGEGPGGQGGGYSDRLAPFLQPAAGASPAETAAQQYMAQPATPKYLGPAIIDDQGNVAYNGPDGARYTDNRVHEVQRDDQDSYHVYEKAPQQAWGAQPYVPPTTSEEPFERWAATLQRGAQPPGGRREGAFTRGIEALPRVAAGMVPQPPPPGASEDELAKWGFQTALGLVGARGPFAKPGQLGIFGGKIGARNLYNAGYRQPLEALQTAEEMEARGLSERTISAATNPILEGTRFSNVHKGTDGKWRFEISDENAALKPYTPDTYQQLSEHLHHPELFAAYPELAEIPTLRTEEMGGMRGSYMPGPRGERYMTIAGERRPLSTVLHEGMHAIQNIEGFAPGASTFGLKPGTPAWNIYQERLKSIRDAGKITREEFSRKANYEGLAPEKDYKDFIKTTRKIDPIVDRMAQESAIEEAYKRAAGEAEARNVSARMAMTPEQRAAKPPETTLDVPRERQIVGKPSAGMSTLEPVEYHPFEAEQAVQQRSIIKPVRLLHPGIYGEPEAIVAKARAQLAPEHPALKELFGVTREDLYNISQQGRRGGNMEPFYKRPEKPSGSYMAENIMTGENAERILRVLREAEKYPELLHGMDAWYVMDPAFRRLQELEGKRAVGLYKRFNTLTSMASPGSDVLTEIRRGTAANMMAERGQFGKFEKYGGMAEAARGRGFPKELRDIPGHPYHSTAQAVPMGKYVKSGILDMTQPKVPLYIQASGVPETGFQTKLPVPDAHFTRAVGMADVRTTANPGASMKGPEYHQTGPWFREHIAEPLGIQAVPAQARMWSIFGPQTGVETAIGAPKLELLAQRIWDRAQQLGMDPKRLRDDVLRGKNHALWAGLTAGLGAAGTTREDAQEGMQ